MGGGSKRPNTPDVPKRSGGLMTSDGELALSCPEEGRVALRPVKPVKAGTRGDLLLAHGDVAFFVGGSEIGTVSGPESELIARCLEREFTYKGQVEIESGKSYVHYWIS